ncbi:hypothetical protein BDQ17DRAFT_720026 [Cyathus striatus]|nr:hypothetical protein BDQ17DRAFT_720026 [Cyathus striatus]
MDARPPTRTRCLERVYDSTISTLSDTLITPLKTLYETTQRQDADIREAEALLGAFGEEMEDIHLPPFTKDKTENKQNSPPPTLQTTLQTLLKQHLKSPVLLTPTDTLETLTSLPTLVPIPPIPLPSKLALLSTFHSPQMQPHLESIARQNAERLEKELKRLEGEVESVLGRGAMGKGGRTARRLDRWMGKVGVERRERER